MVKAILNNDKKKPCDIIKEHELFVQIFREHQWAPRCVMGSENRSLAITNPCVPGMKTDSSSNLTGADATLPELNVLQPTNISVETGRCHVDMHKEAPIHFKSKSLFRIVLQTMSGSRAARDMKYHRNVAVDIRHANGGRRGNK